MRRSTQLPHVPSRYKRLVTAVSTERGVTVEPGWGEDSLVLKADGKIFAILGRGGLVVKLPKSRVDELLGQGGGERFDPRSDGRLMKEWLVAANKLDSIAMAREALAFVGGGAGKRPARKKHS
jgi:hypothetical protein